MQTETTDLFNATMEAQSRQVDLFRQLSKDVLHSPYRLLLSPAALSVVDRITDSCYFIGASDNSALSFLATYIRLQCPQKVLELGTFGGFFTVVCADLLRSNRQPGNLTSVDIDPKHTQDAASSILSAGLGSHATLISGSSTAESTLERLRQIGPFDMIYIDSSHSYELTLLELDTYTNDSRLSNERTAFFFHDSAPFAANFDPTGQGGVGKALISWQERNKDRYAIFSFEPPIWPNPCGLAVMRRLGPT